MKAEDHFKLADKFDEWCNIINRMAPDQQLVLGEIQFANFQWNTWIYGNGRDGFERAVRGKVMGSAYGTVEFRWHVDPRRREVKIIKHAEGERVFDRDGNRL